jgi:tetratricopeptide (TPR) repeat protein
MPSTLSKEPDTVIVQEFASLLKKSSDYKAILVYLNNLLADYPSSYIVQNFFGSCELKNSNHEKALEYFNKSLEYGCDKDTYNNNIGAINNFLGGKSFIDKDYDKALTLFLKALNLIKIDPIVIYINIYKCHRELKAFEAAENILFELLKVNPSSSVAYYHLFELRQVQSNYSEALTYAEKSYNLALSSVIMDSRQKLPIYIKYSNLLKNFGKISEGILVSIKAYMINPNDYIFLIDIILTYISIGNFKKAENYLLDLQKLDVKESIVDILFAYLAFKNDDLKKAKTLFDQCKSKYPDEEFFNYYYAEFCFFTKDFDNASFYYNKCKNISIIDKKYINNFHHKVLECLFYNKDTIAFNKQLDTLIQDDIIRPNIASISAYNAFANKTKDIYPYCEDPLKSIYTYDLSDSELFNNTDLNNEISNFYSSDDFILNLPKSDISNGYQTTGNFFLTDGLQVANLKKIIHNQLNFFINNHPNKNDALVKDWSDDYVLICKIGKFYKGGNLIYNIKDKSWISGLINVSKSPNTLDLNFSYDVFSNDNENSLSEVVAVKNNQIIIFPSSLLTLSDNSDTDDEKLVILFNAIPRNRYK